MGKIMKRLYRNLPYEASGALFRVLPAAIPGLEEKDNHD